MAKVLGKGLRALIKSNQSEADDGHIYVDMVVPNPNQPRNKFNSIEMNELIQSISEKGIIQPIAVKKINDNKFELISGERRWRAAKSLKLSKIPAYIINIKNDIDSMELALIENIQRVNLNPMEEAEAYQILITKYKQTQKMIAKKVSKSRSEIANRVRLLKLPGIVQDSIKTKKIDYGHARALLGIDNSNIILKIYQTIINRGLSVRKTEELIKSYKNKKNIKSSNQNRYAKQISWLKDYLDTKIGITCGKKNKIIIEFSNTKKLNEIIDKIINE